MRTSSLQIKDKELLQYAQEALREVLKMRPKEPKKIKTVIAQPSSSKRSHENDGEKYYDWFGGSEGDPYN